ncbi:MAG: glutathione S-transferase N-terminal domain-containing protein, partial [Alphaproteobacteria bacterium]|nr:glutathione S-transferase N-terminal domain-containing protein [Alphaproteobacteria bacterium]
MIELYTWKTSNGRKATIMLEECGLAYNLHPIDISKDDQFTPEFVAINPNSKIPAIIDTDGPGGKPYTVIESGAILMYLAEKTGKFMPQEMA